MNRADTLRREILSLTTEWSTDTAATLIRPTKAQAGAVDAVAENMALKTLLFEIAVLAADAVATEVEQQGMRPADYWRMTSVPETIAKRLGKALSDNPTEFLAAFQSAMKGRG